MIRGKYLRERKGIRFKRRVKSRVANSVKEFNSIDMNKLFKDDILSVNVNVKGETDDYVVRISFGGFLEILHDEIEKNNGVLNLKCVTVALVTGFNKDDIFINCNCCLKGDTPIKLLNGEVITVAEMCDRYNRGEKMWVYSTDDKGDFKPGEVENVFISNRVNDTIRVTLDNDKVIETTPNHLYMLRDGTYIRADELVVKMGEIFDVMSDESADHYPMQKGEFTMYLEGKWYRCNVRKEDRNDDPVEGLDVSILQKKLLTPVLGIGDPRVDKRIDFVGGIRGLGELEKRVASDCKVAFAMYPTSIQELFDVADADMLMPPKSTWFEPKLRSGLFIHKI